MTTQWKPRLFFAVLVAIPAIVLVRVFTYSDNVSADALTGEALPFVLEEAIGETFPLRTRLQQLSLEIRLAGGQREQDGIFISQNALMRNIPEPVDVFVSENTQAVADFAVQLHEAGSRKHTYLAIIPTSSAIYQQNLPQFAQSFMVNQKREIEDIYSAVSEDVRVVDIYSALLSHQNQYIYYRTENNLTSLGGYYVYDLLGTRLGILDRSLSQYDITYVAHDFYGDLYRDYPYRDIQPDAVSLYRYNVQEVEYTVTHHQADQQKTYHTLYPTHVMELQPPLNVYLGGLPAVLDIETTSPSQGKLLVFGDKTASAYLPFLVNHYQQVTFVSLGQMRDEDYATVHPEEYDQVLFCYGMESFLHTRNPSLAQGVKWDD